MKLLVKFFSVFLLALMITACSSPDEEPVTTTKEFVSALYKGDVDKVISLLYFPENKATSDMISTEDMLKSKLKFVGDQAIKHAKEHGGLDKIECTLASYTNEEKTAAIVKTTTFFKDGSNVEGKDTTLVKINGKWLVKFN